VVLAWTCFFLMPYMYRGTSLIREVLGYLDHKKGTGTG